MNWTYGRRIRQAVQILAFALYIFLSFAALQRWNGFYWADLFFRLDPLTALVAMLADRAWIPWLGWAFIIVALTVLVGRVWCGWLCPLGTLLEWVRFPSAQRRRAKERRFLAKHQREQVGEIELQKPYVVADLCIGCGICEQHCPLAGEAAIRVYRHQFNP